MLEHAFDKDNALAYFLGISSTVPHLSPVAPCFLVIDQLTADTVSTSINATGHQLVLLRRSVCEEENLQLVQLLEPLMSS